MKLFRAFAVTSAVLAFAIAVLGSWVRINGAGMTCPDWPLCHGSLVPSLEGGVVLEWTHRLIALIEGFVLIGAIVTGLRVRAKIAGVTQTLVALAVVFVVQVALGGATVLLNNTPVSVVLHWATAMLLLAALVTLAILSVLAPPPGRRPAEGRFGGAFPALVAAAGFGFVTMCFGAYVSSSGAGLACATVPGCDGTLLGHGAPQAVQMLHRLFAFSFAIVAIVAAVVTARSGNRRASGAALVGVVLIALQLSLGFANVLLQLPTALREAHAANAGFTFVAFVVAAVLAVLDEQSAHDYSLERGRSAARPVRA